MMPAVAAMMVTAFRVAVGLAPVRVYAGVSDVSYSNPPCFFLLIYRINPSHRRKFRDRLTATASGYSMAWTRIFDLP
jgi:hypothetical protein